jgi:hypothetical protein
MQNQRYVTNQEIKAHSLIPRFERFLQQNHLYFVGHGDPVAGEDSKP